VPPVAYNIVKNFICIMQHAMFCLFMYPSLIWSRLLTDKQSFTVFHIFNVSVFSHL